MKNILPEHYNVSRETSEKLNQYCQELLKWNKRINLISPSTENNIWERHILDSARLVTLIPDNTKLIVDLGSGAGLPGAIIAILTNIKTTLIESDQRKCAFLQHIAATISPNIKVINDRIENIKDLRPDIITARALAPLPKLIDLAKPLFHPGCKCLFLKGENITKEIKSASASWDLTYEIIKDKNNDVGDILSISKIVGK
ncbi:16S rRNA (guanine(527)-N(7))-methyltransferase RsmG [Rickettsiales bacterium]|nr:16S rRNA (guanine(527)-N(7))-methyltransferase RsmG [Rickettsiales bacterium]